MLAELNHEIEILQALHDQNCLQTHDGFFVKNQLDDRRKKLAELTAVIIPPSQGDLRA